MSNWPKRIDPYEQPFMHERFFRIMAHQAEMMRRHCGLGVGGYNHEVVVADEQLNGMKRSFERLACAFETPAERHCGMGTNGIKGNQSWIRE